MTLRFRLIGLVVIALAISIAVGGVIVSLIASRSVRTEMDAALLVGRQAVENAIKTVANNCAQIKAKLGVQRTAELVRIAVLFGIGQDGPGLASPPSDEVRQQS